MMLVFHTEKAVIGEYPSTLKITCANNVCANNDTHLEVSQLLSLSFFCLSFFALFLGFLPFFTKRSR